MNQNFNNINQYNNHDKDRHMHKLNYICQKCLISLNKFLSNFPFTAICYIRESVDSLCRDGADTPIVRVHWKAFLTREYSRFKPFSAREWPIQPLLYPMIPHK